MPPLVTTKEEEAVPPGDAQITMRTTYKNVRLGGEICFKYGFVLTVDMIVLFLSPQAPGIGSSGRGLGGLN